MRKIVLELTEIELKDGNDNPCKGCVFDDMNLQYRQYRDDAGIACLDKFPCTHSTVWKVIKP
jgi:hypothetical protein